MTTDGKLISVNWKALTRLMCVWLFVGYPEAGERSAVIYTLLGSCRRHGLNPFDYLKDLFTRLPAAKITAIKQFTPSVWAKAPSTRLAPAA